VAYFYWATLRNLMHHV